jgi:hypothetical protein
VENILKGLLKSKTSRKRKKEDIEANVGSPDSDNNSSSMDDDTNSRINWLVVCLSHELFVYST